MMHGFFYECENNIGTFNFKYFSTTSDISKIGETSDGVPLYCDLSTASNMNSKSLFVQTETGMHRSFMIRNSVLRHLLCGGYVYVGKYCTFYFNRASDTFSYMYTLGRTRTISIDCNKGPEYFKHRLIKDICCSYFMHYKTVVICEIYHNAMRWHDMGEFIKFYEHFTSI